MFVEHLRKGLDAQPSHVKQYVEMLISQGLSSVDDFEMACTKISMAPQSDRMRDVHSWLFESVVWFIPGKG